jgi:hypothetical protein
VSLARVTTRVTQLVGVVLEPQPHDPTFALDVWPVAETIALARRSPRDSAIYCARDVRPTRKAAQVFDFSCTLCLTDQISHP